MTANARVLRLSDGRKLGCAEWGDPGGYPVFYFHGTPGSRLEGAIAGRAAAGRGFRLIALDRPGYGLSTFQRDRRFRDWPDDVRAVADELGLRTFGVVGHSGAGPYLFACGAAFGPERLKFVGALGPWGPATVAEVVTSLNPLDRFYSGLARRAPWTMRLFFAPLGWCARYLPGLFLLLLTSAVPPADRRALRDPRLRGWLRAAEAEAFRQGGRGGAYEAGLAYRDWDVDLGDVRVPTHIWLGDRDIFVPRAMGRHLERAIPGVDFHWVDGAGHFAVDTWDDVFAACAADLPGTPGSPHRPPA